MALFNSEAGYGGLTKLFHWLIVLVFAFQYIGGNIMTSMQWGDTYLSLSQAWYYNWHKSLGLVALVIAIMRLTTRQVGELPPWASTLSDTERKIVHRLEQLLYLAMFVMPISGYIYVMAGGFGVNLFGVWKMPNPIGKIEEVKLIAKWVHIVSGYVLAAAILGHLAIVLRHQVLMRDGLLKRMLPGKG